ncbi:TIGR00730 family Rossman fold protein [Arcicella sp. DC2W]|uniref:Cytokinin riboside 5'-monophosphate phosphoribohydrolase n=1 Tax=Arcicella gelida TaxID=2984195 RepID=A0ABU5S972_9BACT|nr:TIGR00730 family Rossman fold protein [Arcicella sp. DC2W]MEA5405023.1 TIGR00730 family Rossman fold protein [Arcicella sp. DC2W]
MKNVLVYCGSSFGRNEIYKSTAKNLGEVLAKQSLRLIYGGGSGGLMGVVADAVLENSGEVTGIIPSFMEEWEVQHKGLTECIVVDSMHVRKQLMAEKADAVIALPGGWGTLDELFEILTWRQIGLHKMPIGLLNTNGFYDDLIVMLNKMVTEGFVREANAKFLIIDDNIDSLIEKLRNDSHEGELIGKMINKA